MVTPRRPSQASCSRRSDATSSSSCAAVITIRDGRIPRSDSPATTRSKSPRAPRIGTL